MILVEHKEIYSFRNQILCSKEPVKCIKENFNFKKWRNVNVYYDKNIPVLESENIFFLGWAWDCSNGMKVKSMNLQTIEKMGIQASTIDFSGRYLIFFKDSLYTDATCSFSVYYDDISFCTSLSLLLNQNRLQNPEMISGDFYRYSFSLPPYTPVKGVKRLIPGEFFDLKEMKSKSINDYLACTSNHGPLEEQVSELGSYLIGCANGLFDLVGSNYRQMLTGGKDSRLSLLSMLAAKNGSMIKTFTHTKPIFCNDRDDIHIPSKLKNIIELSHIFTYPSNSHGIDWDDLILHDPILSKEREPGSTGYYYKKGNWMQIQEKFLIDNYYETGRMHLHGKGLIPTENHLTLKNILASDFQSNEVSFSRLTEHMKLIGQGCDLLDVFYFVKNYTNVANQFGLIDFSHNPLIFCNSRNLFLSMLRVPEKFRKKGFFHSLLLNSLSDDQVRNIPCNPSSGKIFWRLIKKINQRIARSLYQ